MTDKPFVLSVVATSRNDNHGKNLHYRMQQFVNGFVEQCKRHDLKAELILVEWNPPDDTMPLSQSLHFPKEKGPCCIRIIQVPKDAHRQLEHSDKIPLYQMIGKNVGIRRAQGEFVLATNIDIIFSDEIMQHIKTRLKSGYLYRVDRLDVPEKLPESASYEDILSFCSENIIRINSKFGTRAVVKRNRWLNVRQKILSALRNISIKQVVRRTCQFLVIRPLVFLVNNSLVGMSKKTAFLAFRFFKLVQPVAKKIVKFGLGKLYFKRAYFPHTNACGDFTLLSSKDWENLKGYPEWNIFSWHLDSVLIQQARQHGIKEIDLPRKMSVYHIEHEAGSGFSPEGAHLLFKRLDERGIPYLSNSDLDKLVFQMKNSKEKVIYNNEDWGMGQLSLETFNV